MQPTPVFFLENSMDRGAWLATVLAVAKSQAQLSNWAHTYHCTRWVMKKVFDNIQERKKKEGRKKRKDKPYMGTWLNIE